jgi:hypothetical protein
MNYPVWDVPFIGSVWVVGLIAIFHVMISHFAVGGSFYPGFCGKKSKARGQGRLARSRPEALEVLSDSHRRFRRGVGRPNLVRDRSGQSREHQHPDS